MAPFEAEAPSECKETHSMSQRSIPRAPRPARRAAGFSMIELLIVVLVLGLLTALAYPAINALRGQSESAMFGIGSTLQAAQREAVAQQHDVRVEFSGANRILLIYDLNNNGLADPGERTRGVGLDASIVFGRGAAPARGFGPGPISLSTGGTALVFHRNGSANASGGLYLTTVRGASGSSRWSREARAIEIIRATGRAEWWRYNGSAWVRGF